MAVGVTWQLELCRGPAEDGLAGLFRWGLSMLVFSGLSSGTSSLSPEENLLVFCLEMGGPVVGVGKSRPVLCLPTLPPLLSGCGPPLHPACCPPSRDPLSRPLQRVKKPPVLGQGVGGAVTQLHELGGHLPAF